MATYKDLKDKLVLYMGDEELKLVHKAYLYALKKHFGQKRLTGEEYITHPIEVALILANIKADKETICAGILHDVLKILKHQKKN